MENNDTKGLIEDDKRFGDEMLVVPNGVSRITNRQFAENMGIIYAHIPDGVDVIEEEAFADCKSLEWVRMPNSIKNMERYSFHSCESLRGIVVPMNVKRLGYDNGSSYLDAGDEGIFENCKSLKKVILPYGLETIGQEIFKGCIALNNIIIPETVKYIGKFAFEGCISLEEIHIPASVREIKYGAFKNCSTLREICLCGDNLIIGASAFKGCSRLEKVKVETSGLSVSEGAFAGCKALQSISLNGSCLQGKINGVFNNCSPEIEIGWDAVKKVNGLVLEGNHWQYINSCLSCTSIIIPESISYLGQSDEYLEGGSFGNVRNTIQDSDSLENIIIPEHVRSIGECSFKNCPKLKSIEIHSPKTKICGVAFSECNALEAIYVPKGCKDIIINQLNGGYLKLDTLVQEYSVE